MSSKTNGTSSTFLINIYFGSSPLLKSGVLLNVELLSVNCSLVGWLVSSVVWVVRNHPSSLLTRLILWPVPKLEGSWRIKMEFLVQMNGVGQDDTGVLATNTWRLDNAVRRSMTTNCSIFTSGQPLVNWL